MKSFVFDAYSFKTFLLLKAKYTRKNYKFHEAMARMVMTVAFHHGLTPKYILNSEVTRSGVDEPYIQFAKEVDTAGQKVIDISEYRKS